jgi:hypothetical protein
MQFAIEKVVWIVWRYAEAESVPNLQHTNYVIGTYVTADASIQLYGYLDLLGDRALYCDTVSVIYVQPRQQPQLNETGDVLGAMNSELAHNEHIVEWA